MHRQGIEQRIGELARGFVRGKLGRYPQGVEVRIQRDCVVVRIRGFLAWTEHGMVESPTDRPSVEESYLRLFDQIAPLLRAGIREATGRGVLEVQPVLNLPADECVLWLTLRRENTAGFPVVNGCAPSEARWNQRVPFDRSGDARADHFTRREQ